MALTPWSREDVVNRALSTLDWFGYYYGGNAMYGIQYVYLNSNGVPTLGGGNLIAADCSAFASWCWNRESRISSRGFADIYHTIPKAANTGNAETDFPGINLGDLLLAPGSHVAVYIGAQQTAEMHTSRWAASTNGQGGSVRRWDAYSKYSCYVPFDNEHSDYYDDENPEYNPWDGSDPPPPPYDASDVQMAALVATYGLQYTKRYLNMKHWRL